MKIDADHYIFIETGEIREFVHLENRADDLNSVRASLGKLRDYLNTNIVDVSNCRWVTLTYAENMTDTKRLYNDFRKFNQRMRYDIGHYEYIVAYEPQGRGAWHMHMVMIFDHKAPFIEAKHMADIWKLGTNVTVKRLDDVDNVGAYLTGYLGDMEVDDKNFPVQLLDGVPSPINGTIKEVTFTDETGQQKTKKFIKGARLHLYPPGFNLYSCSKGIKKPEVYYINAKDAEKKVSADTLTFERTIKLSDDEKGFTNTINYRYYNKARLQKQEVKI